jgi:hypothetical protein
MRKSIKAELRLVVTGAILIAVAAAGWPAEVAQALGFIGLMLIVIGALRQLAIRGAGPPGPGGPCPPSGHHGAGGGHH